VILLLSWEVVLQRVQKTLLLLLAVVLACSMGAMLGGCTNSEQAVRDGVAKELDSIKNKNPEDLADIRAELESLFEGASTDGDSFVNTWLDGFDYSIGDVNVQDSKATVAVDITVKQLGPILDSIAEEFQAEVLNDPDLLELSKDELYGKLLIKLTEAVSATVPTTTAVTLPYVLTGNTWTAGEGFQAELEKALLGESVLMRETADGESEDAAAENDDVEALDPVGTDEKE
jgi:hypothetical protein